MRYLLGSTLNQITANFDKGRKGPLSLGNQPGRSGSDMEAEKFIYPLLVLLGVVVNQRR